METSDCGRGTVNSLLRTMGGWLVGVDADSSDTITVDIGNNIKHQVCITLSDNDLKCCEIINGVLLTASGKASRCNAVRDHLKSIVQGQESEWTVSNIYYSTLDYLANNMVAKIEDNVSMFLIGPDNEGKLPVAYLVGDGITPREIKENYHSIGSGGRHATTEFQNKGYQKTGHIGNSSVGVDLQNMFDVLFTTTLRNPGCGGDLRVWYVTNDSTKELKFKNSPSSHCLDIALTMGIDFSKREMFFLDKHQYVSMNYDVLQRHLRSLGYMVRRPASLGWVHSSWKLYVVEFDTAECCQRFFNSPDNDRCEINQFRRITYHRQTYRDIFLYFIPASKNTLELLRSGHLLNKLT